MWVGEEGGLQVYCVVVNIGLVGVDVLGQLQGVVVMCVVVYEEDGWWLLGQFVQCGDEFVGGGEF